MLHIPEKKFDLPDPFAPTAIYEQTVFYEHKK